MPSDSAESLVSAIKENNHLLKKLISRKHSFYRGIYSGLGASIGATLVVAILLWIFAQLEYIPFIGVAVHPANEFLRQLVPNSVR